jgi:undecaprenyl-diphosphatase
MLSYFQAIVIGVLQGATELFPVSSLGHSVLVPAWLNWNVVLGAEKASESFYLAFLVGLHVATALVLLVYFRRDWVRIIKGFFDSIKKRQIQTPDERLAWLLIIATIPAGLLGLVFEHELRVVFAKPLAAGIFLTINGLILIGGERLRRRSERIHAENASSARHLETVEMKEAGVVGVAQTAALFAGISRSGITMVAGLFRGLNHEDAARFSFLLATPIILAAGVYKLPNLIGSNGSGVRGQVVVGSVCAAAASYVSVRFLMRYFRSNNLNPFGVYCLIFGFLSVIRFA